VSGEEEAVKCVRVDYDSGERVYLQLVRVIRDMIISGELPVGAQIPSGAQMKRQWGVNRLTGAMAVEELRKAGLVITKPGVGTFVAATPERQTVHLNPGDRVMSRMPTEEERDKLSTGYLTPVLVITRADGRVEPYNAAVTIVTSPGQQAQAANGNGPGAAGAVPGLRPGTGAMGEGLPHAWGGHRGGHPPGGERGPRNGSPFSG